MVRQILEHGASMRGPIIELLRKDSREMTAADRIAIRTRSPHRWPTRVS